MSFDRLPSLEAQPTTSRSTGYSDSPEFDRLTTQLSSQLFTLTSNISTLNRELSLVGTKRDSEALRERVKKLLNETRAGFKSVGEGVKKVQDWPDVSPSQRFVQQKLSREMASTLTDFQTIQRLSAEKTREYVTAARQAQHLTHDEGVPTDDLAYSPSRGQQQQVQVPLVQQQLALAEQSEVDFQESLIIEREEEIRGIEQGITELNEIFRDLGTMVNQQGEMIDDIEVYVGNTATSTKAADQELSQAARYQKGARNKACCLLLILSIILTVVLLAIFLG
ncbi:t-SNARE [Choiromyces venosus 120613-1]|uniref:t-SNARE n=1 Tax=Choiromyces venosus 120613-1 TaxID=1336337 RepID=A0A3N4IZ63_9PEZI|nr:t-SNARE [Choiromyces venosus 120613-1]